MPSNASSAVAANANSDVLVLISLICTATEFKADMKEMAKICKISHEKNVPRKINAIVSPHGYKFEHGRIVEKDGMVTGKGQGGNAEKALKTPTKTVKNANKTPKSKEPKTPKSNKRRKIEEHEAEPEDEDADMVKADMEPAAEEGNGTEQDEGGLSEDCVEAEAE